MRDKAKLVEADVIRFDGRGGVGVQADVVAWAERQATLLSRLAAGEQVNEQVEWEEIAEEIESVGASERRSLRSRVRDIIEHLAKLAASQPEMRVPAGRRRSGVTERISRVF